MPVHCRRCLPLISHKGFPAFVKQQSAVVDRTSDWRRNRDIRIAGGADVIQHYLNLGAVDELEIALAPVLFCGGRRLFENLNEPGPQFRIDKVIDSPSATHLRYVRQ